MSRSTPERSGISSVKFSIFSLLLNLLAIALILAVILLGSAGRLDWLQAWLFVLAFASFLVWWAASVNTFLSAAFIWYYLSATGYICILDRPSN